MQLVTVFKGLILLVCCLAITACASSMTTLTQQQNGKAILIVYDSNKIPQIISPRIYLDGQIKENLSALHPSIFYLSPGIHQITITFPEDNYNQFKTLNLKSNQYTFLRLFNRNSGGWGADFTLDEVPIDFAKNELN